MVSIDFAARALLVAEAIACLWLTRWCWRQGAKGSLQLRLSARLAAILFAAAAGVILYGLIN